MEHPLQRLWNKSERLVIGFMSGTSADGVDAALVRISGYGVETRLTQLAFCFTPFDEATRAEVLRLAGGGSAAAADFCRINFHLGQLYCEAGDALCRQAGIERAQVDLIGCHGQTLWHIPQEEIYLGRSQHSTFQLGESAMLAEHLYQLGHRKLVFISTPFNQLTLAREQRLEGIRKQLELHGVTDGLEVLVADRQAEADSQDDGLPYEYSVGRQLTAELIRRESMATALIGVNDMTALGILSELAAQGLRVPRDFSVCGFDNIFSSSITTPGLTTIDHHLRTRCQAAVDMVITQSTPSRIPTPFVNKIEYTPQLIVRSSTGQSPTHRSSEKI